jgi:hypothetical protein
MTATSKSFLLARSVDRVALHNWLEGKALLMQDGDAGSHVS